MGTHDSSRNITLIITRPIFSQTEIRKLCLEILYILHIMRMLNNARYDSEVFKKLIHV